LQNSFYTTGENLTWQSFERDLDRLPFFNVAAVNRRDLDTEDRLGRIDEGHRSYAEAASMR
jgi:hypothetical protein